jgi:hypothetical protein
MPSSENVHFLIATMQGERVCKTLEEVKGILSPDLFYGYAQPSRALTHASFMQDDPIFWDINPDIPFIPVYDSVPEPDDASCPIALIYQLVTGKHYPYISKLND